jgi:HAD superfamily hydrolase (TIGR01549 family)
LPKKPVPALNERIIRCILFDLGDTLWSRKDANVWQQMEGASNQRAVALLRQHVSPALLPTPDDDILGQRLRDSLDEQVRAAIRLDPGREPNGALAIVQALRQWGIDTIDLSLGAALFEALRVRIPESRPLFDDVLPTLAELRQRGFLLGVVTNRLWGGPIFQEDVQTLGLLDHFDYHHMAISADLGIRKPHPAIFQHALNSLQVVPEQAVMVGDSLRADIVGAQRLGIFTIWKPKPDWRKRIQAQLVTPGASVSASTGADTSLHQTLVQAELTSGEQVDVPPPGVHITDDDFVLAQVKSQDGLLDHHIRGNITPDLVIENISDLLDIFFEAGKQ